MPTGFRTVPRWAARWRERAEGGESGGKGGQCGRTFEVCCRPISPHGAQFKRLQLQSGVAALGCSRQSMSTDGRSASSGVLRSAVSQRDSRELSLQTWSYWTRRWWAAWANRCTQQEPAEGSGSDAAAQSNVQLNRHTETTAVAGQSHLSKCLWQRDHVTVTAAAQLQPADSLARARNTGHCGILDGGWLALIDRRGWLYQMADGRRRPTDADACRQWQSTISTRLLARQCDALQRACCTDGCSGGHCDGDNWSRERCGIERDVGR